MPVNHAKEFLKSIHNEALFSQLFARVQIAPICFCLNINAPKLFQGFMIIYYLVISGLIVDSPKVGMIYYTVIVVDGTTISKILFQFLTPKTSHNCNHQATLYRKQEVCPYLLRALFWELLTLWEY